MNILPRAATVLTRMREMQQKLKRLAVLWSSKSAEAYLKEVRKAAESVGIEILSERLNTAADLPNRL